MMNFIEQSIGNAQKYNEAAAKLALNVSRRVVQVLDEKEQGDASDTLRTVMGKLVEDDQKMSNNMATFRSLKTQLSKLDCSDWPDIEQEFKKLQEALPNIRHIFLIYSRTLLDFIPAFGVYYYR